MIADSKLKTITKQIEKASHSLEQLAFQERYLLQQIEEVKYQMSRDNREISTETSFFDGHNYV